MAEFQARTGATPTSLRVRRPRLRRAALALSSVAAVLVAAFATLPWWIPLDWTRARVERALSDAIGGGAVVGALTVSWTDGFVLRDLRIRPRGESHDLLSVREIRAHLDPWQIVTGRAMRRITVTDPEISLAVDTHGRLNAERLRPAKPGGWPPAEAIEITGARLTLEDARTDTVAELELGEIALNLDRASGRADARIRGTPIRTVRTSAAAPASGAVEMTAGLNVPALRAALAQNAAQAGDAASDVPELSGEGVFRWTDVDMASLPLELIPGLSGLRVRGRSSGELAASVGPMLAQSLALRAEVKELTISRDGGTVVDDLPWCRLLSAGTWNPVYDVLELSQLSYEMPGVEVQGRPVSRAGPVLTWSLGGETILQAALTGRLADIRQVRALLPSRLATRLLGAPGNDEAFGRIQVEAAVVTQREGSSLELALKSDGLQLATGSPLRLRKTTPVETRVRARRIERSGVTRIEELVVALGGVRLSGHATLPDSGASSAIGSTEAVFSASIADLDELASMLPAQSFAWRATGPARLDFRLHGGNRGGDGQLTAVIDADSDVDVPDVFRKPSGAPLVIEGAARWDGSRERCLQSLRFAARSGAAVIELRGESDPDECAPVSWDLRSVAAPDRTDANPRSAGAITLDASLRATLSLDEIERWLEMLPAVADARRHVDVRGAAAVSVTAHLRHSAANGNIWPELYRVSAEGVADEVELTTAGGVRKPRGEPARWAVDYRFDRSRPRDMHRLSCRAELPSATLNGSASLGGGRARVGIEGAVRDVARFARRITPAAGWSADQQLAGSATFHATWLETPEFGEREFAIDLTNASISPAGGDESGWRKQGGTPMRLEAAFRVARPLAPVAGDESGWVRWDVETARFEWGGLRIGVPRGRLLFEPALEHRWLDELASGRLPSLRTDPDGWKCDFEAKGSLAASGGTLELPTALGIAELRGQVTGSATCTASPDGLTLRGRVDATAAHVRLSDGGHKPEGMMAVVSINGQVQPRGPADDPLAELALLLQSASLHLADGLVRAAGEARWPLRGPDAGHPWVVHAGGDLEWSDLSRLEPLLPRHANGLLKAISAPRGGMRGRIGFSRHDDGSSSPRASVTFDRTTFTVAPAGGSSLPVELDGRLEVDDRAIRFHGVDVRLGASRVSLGGDLRMAGDGLDGQLVLASPQLDARELLAIAASMGHSTEVNAAGARREETLRVLRASNVRLTAHAAHAEFPGFSPQTDFPVDELSVDATVQRGQVSATFSCAANDGTVNGTWRTDLSKNDPTFHLAYTARHLTASPNTRPIVEAFFPGMLVKGRLTLIDESHQRLFAPPGQPNFPTGKGEMILENGQVVGRAAPLWVTSIFPSLNLAEFNYTHMINRFEKLDDGTHLNDMTFFGSVYHVYATGYTRADGDARYEVGVDLLARLSPDLSRIGQGRIALFNKTGRIRDGRFENEVVSYLDPVTVTKKIFSNNVLTIAYHAIRQRVVGPTSSDERSSASSTPADGGAAD